MTRGRSTWAFCISVLLLLLANALIPPPSALPTPDQPLVVELIPDEYETTVDTNELPFLPQQIPDDVVPPPDEATVTDAFNRQVERETMARRSASQPVMSKPEPARTKESSGQFRGS